MTIVLAAAAAFLIGTGTCLLLQRKLSRIIIGLGLVTHGANVLLITSGRRGDPPIIGEGDADRFSDPLPQALALTSIVITFAVTVLLLALAYRSWLLTRDDEVEDDVKRILSFTIVSQIGYMVMGLALFSTAGVAAAVFSMVHHIIVTTALFLTGGLIEHATGSSRLRRVGGMVRTAPIVAVLFLLSALSLAGIPPLSGFVSKFALVDARVSSSQYAIVAVSLVVSLFTLFSMIRIWSSVFWNPAEDPELPSDGGRRDESGGRYMVIPTAVLVACSIGVAVAAGPIYSISGRSASDLLEPDRYVAQVLER